MSVRDDVARAGDEARAQVSAAKDALAASREARSGGPAKDARQAEQQLHALRGAVADDARALRDRLVGLDPSARRGAAATAAAGAGAVMALVGTGLAARAALRRGAARRSADVQARALAAALARGAFDAVQGATSPGRVRRRGRPALAALALGAVVAGAVAVQRRRSAPVDDADLWLPEQA